MLSMVTGIVTEFGSTLEWSVSLVGGSALLEHVDPDLDGSLELPSLVALSSSLPRLIVCDVRLNSVDGHYTE